jgi:hypothetical protein
VEECLFSLSITLRVEFPRVKFSTARAENIWPMKADMRTGCLCYSNRVAKRSKLPHRNISTVPYFLFPYVFGSGRAELDPRPHIGFHGLLGNSIDQARSSIALWILTVRYKYPYLSTFGDHNRISRLLLYGCVISHRGFPSPNRSILRRWLISRGIFLKFGCGHQKRAVYPVPHFRQSRS